MSDGPPPPHGPRRPVSRLGPEAGDAPRLPRLPDAPAEDNPFARWRINPEDPPPIIKRQYGYVPSWILDGTVVSGKMMNGKWYPYLPPDYHTRERAILTSVAQGMTEWPQEYGPFPTDKFRAYIEDEAAFAEYVQKMGTIGHHNVGGHGGCGPKMMGDFGSAFMMGAVGGAVWHGVKGYRNSPKGFKMSGVNQAISMRASTLGGNFAMWGGIFSIATCWISSTRGKHDPLNAIGAGFITGGALAFRSGKKAALMSACIGGALLGLIEGLQFVMGGEHTKGAHSMQPVPPAAPPAPAPEANGGMGVAGDEMMQEERTVGGIPTGQMQMQRGPMIEDDEDDDDDTDDEEDE